VPDTSPGEDDEARQLFTAGRYYATRRTAEGLRQGIQRLERAVELKPDYAEAYSELADCYSLLNWYVEPPPPEALGKGEACGAECGEANDSLAEAHASLGFVRLHYDRDWEGAERELQKAIVLNPRNQVRIAGTRTVCPRWDDTMKPRLRLSARARFLRSHR
jgi:tetratricopeptide (TPR) repeat protein